LTTNSEVWPALPFPEWKETAATLHMWTQIVGKVRLALTPWINHSWHVTLYLTARGLTTSPIAHDSRCFEIEFDFVGQAIVIRCSDGTQRQIPLRSRSERTKGVKERTKGVKACFRHCPTKATVESKL